MHPHVRTADTLTWEDARIAGPEEVPLSGRGIAGEGFRAFLAFPGVTHPLIQLVSAGFLDKPQTRIRGSTVESRGSTSAQLRLSEPTRHWERLP